MRAVVCTQEPTAANAHAERREAYRRLHQLAVVLDRPVAQALKVKGGVDAHLLAGGSSVRLGPLQLPRVELRLERPVALGAAKAKDLAVVAHKLDALPRVCGPRADLRPAAREGGEAHARPRAPGGRRGPSRSTSRSASRAAAARGAVHKKGRRAHSHVRSYLYFATVTHTRRTCNLI